MSCVAGATYRVALHPAADAAPPAPSTAAPLPPPAATADRSHSAAASGLPPAVFFVGVGATVVLGAITIWSGMDALAAKRALPAQPEQSQDDAVLGRAHRTDALLAGTAVAGLATAAIRALAHEMGGRLGLRRARHLARRRRPRAARSILRRMMPGPVRAPGTPRIGHYELLFELAQGGMGTVFLARAVGSAAGHGGFERLVAIKRLHAHLLSLPESVRRFFEEAKVAARVHHANVVGVHQVGSDEAGQFLVQDYVEGDTLEGLVDHAILLRERLPPPIVLRIAVDALSGLHAVHEATDAEGRPLGILHRDVSTQNLLVGRDGVTRLADFGIAKYAQSSVVTDAAYLQGRVLYMPPEYLDRRPVDRRFDIYGLGLTLWIALAGRSPWPDASDAQILHKATSQGIPALSESGLTIAPAIEALVARACQRDPEARFTSAHAMLEAIEEVGRHTGWIASHAEVATLVERLAGRDLAERREAIARASARIPPASTPAAFSSDPEPDPIDAPPGHAPSPAKRIALAALGLGVVALASVAILARAHSPAPAAVESAQALSAAPPPPIASVASVTPSSSVEALEPAPSAEPPSSAKAARGVRGSSQQKPRSGQPGASTVSAKPEPAAPAAPTTIRTDNPYR